MRLSTFAAGLFSLTLAVGMGCSKSDDGDGGGATGGSQNPGPNAGGSSGTGGSGTGGSATGGGGGSSATGGSSGDASSGGTTYADVKPIFMKYCGDCHVTGKQGAFFHKLAENADDAKKNSSACPGKTKGACTLERVQKGTMPAGANCTGKPAMDASNPKCLTQADQDKLKAWIDGGLQ